MRRAHRWITDDNMRFPSAAAVGMVLRVAHQLQVPIAQPAVTISVHALVKYVRPVPWADQSCSVLFTDFVEIMTPILRPCALFEVFSPRVMASHRDSDYGLDAIWCRYLAKLWGYPLERVCAVIRTRANFGKRYASNRTRSYSFQNALKEKGCLKSRLPMHWSHCEVMKVLSCDATASNLGKTLPGAGVYPQLCANGPAPSRYHKRAKAIAKASASPDLQAHQVVNTSRGITWKLALWPATEKTPVQRTDRSDSYQQIFVAGMQKAGLAASYIAAVA